MAAVDKIYGTLEQSIALEEYVHTHCPQWARYLAGVNYDIPPTEYRAIANFSEEADKWLYRNCPYGWVKEAIAAQYRWDS